MLWVYVNICAARSGLGFRIKNTGVPVRACSAARTCAWHVKTDSSCSFFKSLSLVGVCQTPQDLVISCYQP